MRMTRIRTFVLFVIRVVFMPITTSAKKAHRQSLRRRVFNSRRKVALKDALKAMNTTNKKEATAALSVAYKALDKAAKTGVIKKQTASRKKARLAAMVRKMA